MKRTLISPDLKDFPHRVRELSVGAKIYDSSCSPEARVFYIDKGCGYFIKRAARGTLRREAQMTEYFHGIGLSCPVVDYFTEGEDWLITERVKGEDLTHYTERPEWLCDRLAELLSWLHTLSYEGCPVADRTADYLYTARENYKNGLFDSSLFPSGAPFDNPREAMAYIEERCHSLKCDTLLHGDFCLPNIIMDGDSFSGFIDLGGAGVGDRHIDIFWAAWTLNFNLKTDKYRQRFYDAYGRDKIDPDRLKLISVIEMFG